MVKGEWWWYTTEECGRLPVIVSIIHPFNATDGKESFAFYEGVTFIGEAGKLRLLQAGFHKEAFAECKGCDFIGEAGKLRLLQAGFHKEAFAECEGVTFFT